MAWFKKRPKESTRGNAIEAKEAEIKGRAAELQTLAGKGGVPTGEAVTALAAALGNEIAALVPSIYAIWGLVAFECWSSAPTVVVASSIKDCW